MSAALAAPLLALRAKPVFQNEIYWNDWSQLSIFRASKTSGSRMEILVGRLNGIMDMKIFYRGKTTGNCVRVPVIFPAHCAGAQATISAHIS